ncbi:MAG: amino acid adenylation domain-containing protein, partial [Bacteroidota bacterium]
YFTWDADLVISLRQMAKQQETSLFMVVLTGLQVWLHRLTQQDDVVMGTTVAGRHHQAMEPLIGFFVNVLAIRSTFTDRKVSFAQALHQTKENLLAAYDHQDYPFDQLVDELGLAHDSRHQPLFDVLVEYLNEDLFQETPEQLGALQVQDQHLEGNQAKFELTFHFLEEKEGLKLAMEYRRDLWQPATIERWFAELQQLFTTAVAQPDSPALHLNLLPDEGKALQALGQGAAQAASSSVIAQFEQMAQEYPDDIAITERNQTTTYAALDKLASQAAYGLKEKYQVGLNDRVVLLLPRSTEVLVMLLAVQKLGATFVLLDVEHPAAKWKAQLQMAKPKVVVTTLEIALQLEGAVTCPVHLANLKELDGPVSLPAQQKPHTAYLLFTSGSTGNAKGVSISQSAFSHYIQWANQHYFQNQRGYSFPLFTSLAFDLTLTSLFSPLTRGDQVVVIQEGNPVTALEQILHRTDLGAIKLTPSHLRLAATLAKPQESLQVMIVGGEALEWAQIETARGINPAMAIYNEYGPTEATVGCCVARIDHQQGSIPIGKPIANTHLALLDSEQALVPQGAMGELYVGGPQVADGYFENPDLTDQAFMALPTVGKGMFYRTGDFARWDEQGDLHYLGRKEDQYKINGYRVALEEVEEALQKVSELSQSVAGIRTLQDHPTLICWHLGESIEVEGARESLRELLPSYMIPQHFVQVEELPVTENGKLNREILPDPVWEAVTTESAQESSLEGLLIQVWSEVLGRTDITTQDNFFDLGGNSLLLVEVNLKLAQEYPDLTITDLFNQPSLSKLAAFIQQNWGEDTADAFQVVPLALPQEYFSLAEGLGEEKWEVALDAELIGRIQTLSQSHEVPLPSVVVAMFANLLAQTTQRDLIELPYLDEQGDIRNVSLDFASMESQAMLLETVGHSLNGHPGKRALHQLVPPKPGSLEVAPLISINTETAEAELMQHFDLLLHLTPQVDGTWHLSLQYQPLRLNGHKVRGLMESLLDYLEAI